MTFTNWKEFERLVAAIHHSESEGAEVKWNDVINGRQFDVTVRFKYGIHSYLTVIECKNYSGKIPVEKIDALVTKYKDVNANKAVMVSSKGYQSGCISVAEKHGIRLLTLNKNINEDISGLIKEVTPALNIYNIRLVTNKGAHEHELEDIGGRLAYLMGNTRLIIAETHTTLEEIIDRWQLSQPEIYTDRENNIEIPFPSSSVAHIPCEEPINIIALRFKCDLTEILIPNKPIFDNHIRAGLATEYELCDLDGNIEHTKKLVDLKLGFDETIESGKFYLAPSLGNHYYCTSNDNGVVSWVLVESYQHGRLLQARLSQKVDQTSTYVEIKDSSLLVRLRKMLDNYNAKTR